MKRFRIEEENIERRIAKLEKKNLTELKKKKKVTEVKKEKLIRQEKKRLKNTLKIKRKSSQIKKVL